VIPEIKSAEDRENEAYESGEKRVLDRNTASYTGWTALVTLGMLLVAIVQAVMFGVQLSMMRITLKDAKRASDAARASVEVARDSMIIGNRAYVQFKGLIGTPFNTLSGDFAYLRIEPQWTNTGNTPTAVCKIFVRYELTDQPLDLSQYQFSVPHTIEFAAVTISPNAVMHGDPRNLFTSELNDVASGKRFLYAWGTSVYKSVFPDCPDYDTHFCIQIVEVTGNPSIPASPDNLIGVRWIVVGPHNGAT
jgi:hypothetical protein